MLLCAEHLKKDYGSMALPDDVTLYLNAGDYVKLQGLTGERGRLEAGPERRPGAGCT